MWAAAVLTIFPEMFPGPLGLSLAGKALATGLWSLEPVDVRDYATDRHRSVDDTPHRGGPALRAKADVLRGAIAPPVRRSPVRWRPRHGEEGGRAVARHRGGRVRTPALVDEPAGGAAHAGAY